MDPAEAEFNLISCNGDYALNVCSMGLDARIGTEASRYKHFPLVTGPGAYGLSALANIIKGVHRPYRIALNGEVLEGEFTLIFAGNGRWYGSGFHPAPDADPCDGLLDVLLVQPVSRLQVATIIGKYKRGLYANYPELIRHVRTRHLKSNVPPLQKSIWMGSSAGRNRSKSEWQRKISAFFYPKALTWKVPSKVYASV